MNKVKETRHQSSFTAEGSDGRIYTVDVFVDILDASSHGNPFAEVEGLKSLRTRNGRTVNYIEKGKYEIVGGPTLTSDDPNAF